ncbi:AT hook motif-containing protein, putative [Theobroma cacao]|uniref:AT hook motif-containing protein, putative n=1 Tax=Theobroma cacao TaxID=3641 RepID=A0A061FJS8_THECC|nr:AT hook motif-containing protein, putative [Theobroma cacao]
MYANFPIEWVWSKSETIWKKQKRGKSIGMITYIHLAIGELYFMRMLLHVVKGLKSFKELRIIEGVVYPTFQAECEALGLLGDNREWIDAIEQASKWATSEQTQELFVTIIIYRQVRDPLKLWEQSWKLLNEDIEYKLKQAFRADRYEIPHRDHKNYTLVAFKQIFNRNCFRF